jgi:hypothetical protein
VAGHAGDGCSHTPFDRLGATLDSAPQPDDVGELVRGEDRDRQPACAPDLVAKRRLALLERVDGRILGQGHDQQGDFLTHLAAQLRLAQRPALHGIVQKPNRNEFLVERGLVQERRDLSDVIEKGATVRGPELRAMGRVSQRVSLCEQR